MKNGKKEIGPIGLTRVHEEMIKNWYESEIKIVSDVIFLERRHINGVERTVFSCLADLVAQCPWLDDKDLANVARAFQGGIDEEL